MDVKDFYYDLPQELIAQDPLEDRSSSRLLVLDKKTGEMQHKVFKDIVNYLHPGDCLVINDTKVIPARLIGSKEGTDAHIEILLLKRRENDIWETLVKPGKKAKPGTVINFGDGLLKGTVIDVVEEGNRLIQFSYEGIFEEILDQLGQMPLPPYITHRLQEILSVCDKVVIMRDGVVVKDTPASEIDVPEITRCMVGRSVDLSSEKREIVDHSNAKTILSIRNLWVDMPGETVRNVTLDVKEGEILGIGGLAGQGKLGIPNGVMGLYEAGGTVEFDGKPIPLNSPRKCLDASLAFVSEDRRGVGLLLDETLEWNVAFPAMQIQNKFLKKIGPITWRDEKAIHDITQKYINELMIKCTSSLQKARELSGGNQQKICLAKAFALEPRFLFVSEPTRGIDVGAKALVLDALRRFNRESGVTVVMISSELEELRQTCDRIAIVSGGRIAGILPATESSEAFGMLMVSQVK
mgnify:CR=1 FL=1